MRISNYRFCLPQGCNQLKGESSCSGNLFSKLRSLQDVKSFSLWSVEIGSMKATMYQKGVIVVLVNFLYHVHFKAQGEEGWYICTVLLMHWLWKHFLFKISVKLVTCAHCSLWIRFIHVVAILLYKDQTSPSSWQWLTRFEFGSFGGVSLSIRLTDWLTDWLTDTKRF